MIQTALDEGASVAPGPPDEILEGYVNKGWTKDTLPLTALLLSSEEWSTGFDTRAMEFKSACRAMIIKTGKKYYGARGGMTPLLAYSMVNEKKQRHSLCKMILRRTPVAALGQCDEKTRNALYYFIKAGRVQDVKAVVEAGLDPTYLDADGKNALHWECEQRLKRAYSEGKKRDIVDFLLKKSVPVITDNHGNHVLVLDGKIPLSYVTCMDINMPGPDGQTLALAALQHFCWSRWRDLLDDPRTDWMAQIPDVDEFIRQRQQRSFSNDKEAAAMYHQILSIRQQLELDIATPQAAGRARARF